MLMVHLNERSSQQFEYKIITNMHFRVFGILATVFLLASCSSDTCTITGSVSDAVLQKGDVVVTYNMEEQLELKDGHFSVSTDRRDTSAVHFSIRSSESPSIEFVVVPDSKSVEVLINEDGPVFSGSKLTEDLYVLQNSMLTLFMDSNARAMASDDEDVAQAIMKEMHAKMKQLAKDQWDKHPVADALGLQAASMYLREASNKEVIQFIDAAPEGVMNYPQIKQIYEYILDQVDEEY